MRVPPLRLNIMNESQALGLWARILIACIASACFGGDLVVTLIMARANEMGGTVIFGLVGLICFLTVIHSLKGTLKILKEIK